MKSRNLFNSKLKFKLLVGVAAGLGFITLSYAVLRLDSNLGTLYVMTSAKYFYSYISLTIATAILFGIQMSFLVSQWYTYGIKNIFAQSGSGLGAIVSVIASSCPVCGGTVLSLLATVSGLTFLSSSGLELKIISFVLILIATLYTYRKSLQATCDTSGCPVPIRSAFTKLSYVPVIGMLLLFTVIDLHLFASDTITAINPDIQDYSVYSCTTDHE